MGVEPALVYTKVMPDKIELDKIELDKIKQILDAPIFKAEKGDYAMLANENDEQGPVNVFRKNGTIVMTMPREVWDELRGDKS